MLSESFIASLLASGKTPPSSTLRDVGICVQEIQPSPGLRSSFKKSSSSPNCVAVSASHIFAAQADKAVVHVYSRAKGNQEATVPFPERIRSAAVANPDHGGAIIVLGTEGGRLILWEACTGRQISTSASHLQPVTSLVVDPTSNFILSGSADASVHVWSLAGLLSFSPTIPAGQDQLPSNHPIRTFSNHRAALTGIAVGHSSSHNNIAVSIAQDNTAIVWEYSTGSLLRTYLLPGQPRSLVVDPADRAFYVGYEDGSVQAVDFFKPLSVQNILHDANQQATPSQLSSDECWAPPSADVGRAECLDLSYDGITLLSGHQNGSVLAWDISRGKFSSKVADFTHPVTNLQALPPSGFPGQASDPVRLATHSIVKPRHDPNLTSNPGVVPASYVFNTHILSSFPQTEGTSSESRAEPIDEFHAAMNHPVFPASLISEGLAELASFDPSSSPGAAPGDAAGASLQAADMAALTKLEEEIGLLKKQASLNEAARNATTQEIVRLRNRIVSLQESNGELYEKKVKAEQDRAARRARKEEKAARRRKAWFEAEKRGQNGDAVVRKMAIEDGEETSETDDAGDED